jgi:hypothetical protein
LFWILFAATPLLSIGTGMAQPIIVRFVPATFPLIRTATDLTILATLVIGAMAAGYFLAKSQSFGAGIVALCPFHAGWILLAYAVLAGIAWLIRESAF